MNFPDDKVAALAAAMLLTPDKAVAAPEECSHCLKVAINPDACVCALCRTRFDEPTGYGIMLMGPPFQFTGFGIIPDTDLPGPPVDVLIERVKDKIRSSEPDAPHVVG